MPTYENVIPLSQASFSGKLPRKPHNQAVRSREYLTEAEVGKLMKAARNTGRHGHRDATLILIGLPSCAAGLRAGGSALGTDRPQPGIAACGAPEERGGLLPPAARAGDTRPAAATAGLSGDALRLRHRTQGAADRLHGAQAGGKGRGAGRNRLPGPSAHAPSRVRLQAGQRWP